jgi:predicted PurR-regulated permease PerM
MDINEKTVKNVITISLIVVLLFLTILVIKPIFISISFGILLAYVFYPVYKFSLKYFKNPTLTAFILCFVLLMIIIVPLLFFASSLLNQMIGVYLAVQKLNLAQILQQTIPSFLTSSEITNVLTTSLNGLVPKLLSYTLVKISDIVFNLPSILLNFFVIIFIFFFTLRDGQKTIEYLKSLSLFSKEVEEKFFNQFKDITYSVLYGQVFVGIIQGITAGIGYFVFGVSNVMILSLLTTIAAIFPILGAWAVWVPVDIYLFASGKTGLALGMLIYGTIFTSTIDNVIRPIIISRRTNINSGIIMAGMIGGFFVFGIMGFILGPLILAYFVLIIELYRKSKDQESVFIKESK